VSLYHAIKYFNASQNEFRPVVETMEMENVGEQKSSALGDIDDIDDLDLEGPLNRQAQVPQEPSTSTENKRGESKRRRKKGSSKKKKKKRSRLRVSVLDEDKDELGDDDKLEQDDELVNLEDQFNRSQQILDQEIDPENGTGNQNNNDQAFFDIGELLNE